MQETTTNNPVLDYQIAKPNNPVFTKMNRKEIAGKYAVSTKTLTKWIAKAGLKLPTGLLSPSQVEKIWNACGPW